MCFQYLVYNHGREILEDLIKVKDRLDNLVNLLTPLVNCGGVAFHQFQLGLGKSLQQNQLQMVITDGRKEKSYLTTHSTHFIYGYMASDIW